MRVLNASFQGIILLLLFCCGLAFHTVAQERKQVTIEKADRMRNLKRDGLEIRRLIGNVVMRHEDVVMHSDSAYDYTSLNRFDAFGNVRVNQETSTLYGDTLHYDSNLKKGRVRGHLVKLVDEDLTLITHFIDFDTQDQTANFYQGGIITTDSAQFSSNRGIYFSKQKLFAFAGDVAYKDSILLLNTDSLIYNSRTQTIHFFGPSRIYHENSYAYATQGWYNRTDSVVELRHNAYIDYGEQIAFGEKIYYDQHSGLAKIESLGCVIDTVERLTLFANYIEHDRNLGVSWGTNDPFVYSVSEEGDTIFLRADKLINIAIQDSVKTDSTSHYVTKALHNVRFYRKDIQGVCDSMYYHSTDSLLTMYTHPIVWNEENQLTGQLLDILFKDELIHKMHFRGEAFIASQEDSVHFNQVAGKEMEGFFTNGSLKRLEVKGNGQTIYYGREKGRLSAVNRAESTNLTITIVDNKVSGIMFRQEPHATLFPIKDVNVKELTLKGFVWHSEKRPLGPKDILPKWVKFDHFTNSETQANRHRNQKKNPATVLDKVQQK